MKKIYLLIYMLYYFGLNLQFVNSIKCYQCSSDEDKTKDNCGAYEHFDTNKNTAVECSGEDAVNPGTFCYKSIKQGPRGFIWDGRWRTVIRRCAQVSERGISWGCDWGYHENGVYWEECYCAEDGCNSANQIEFFKILLLIPGIFIFLWTNSLFNFFLFLNKFRNCYLSTINIFFNYDFNLQIS